MADIAELTRIIAPEAEAEGLSLVRVMMIGGTDDPTLQVMAEDPASRQLTLGQCETLSRRLSERLDALEAEGADPIEGGYRLEVSSPGIDRPLTRAKDYDDWKGHEARLTLSEPLNGRRQFTGDLLGMEGETVLIDVRGVGPTALPLAAVHSAKLLLTDRLIQATAPLSVDGADDILEGQD
ncbi:MAG: ribosome maturation protein RimP [Sphingosinicella sp.]|uniref:ribosome maturation protein RimP n=1 Tax=Sphingosinicella sp. TaxID=1917971 RepID=UPI004037F7C8